MWADDMQQHTVQEVLQELSVCHYNAMLERDAAWLFFVKAIRITIKHGLLQPIADVALLDGMLVVYTVG
jgi:hypothetical protein